MEVLHLCSYYYGSKLYENLMKELDDLKIDQKVYIPVMNGIKVQAKDYGNCKFIVKETYSSIDRAFFKKKFRQNYKGLIDSVDTSKVDIIHAHTLFTNGVMAYRLKKEYGTPYIVAVRNSDLNTFFKYFIHLRRLGEDILRNAEKIIFISPAYLEETISKYVREEYKEGIRAKSLVIPNGVNQYWIDNINEPKSFNGKFNLFYAGEITENKNIHKVIDDVINMKKKGMDIHYSVVGEGPYKEKIEKLVVDKNASEFINIFHKVDKYKLKDMFRDNNIFVMTSTYETFGLSYIEALSQGLPVLYTKGQGIYGFFDEGKVGYGVELGESIENSLIEISKRYNQISINGISVVEEFRWDSIAKLYNELYKNL